MINSNKYVVTEGVEGTWYYHISHRGTPVKALCGVRTMATSLPITSFGLIKTHLKERYCGKCLNLAGMGAITLDNPA